MLSSFSHFIRSISMASSAEAAAAAAAVPTADVLGLAATTSTSSPTAAVASTAADGNGEGAAAQPIESGRRRSSSSGHPPAVTGTTRAVADPTSKKNTSETPQPNTTRGSSFNDDNDSAYEDVTDDEDDEQDTNGDAADAFDEMSLFELISDRHFAAAIQRCRSHPAEARRWDSVPVGGGTGDDATWSQCLPLHRACSLDPTPDLIAALLAAHSDAVAERESYWGRLPLHVACLSGATYDAIQPLLQRYPQGASVVAIHDRLPIHYACGGNSPRRIVLALLKIYPRGARCLDAYGWLPLHWAATFHKSPAVISAIIEAYPEALHKETNKGKTPFRCARSSKQRDIVDKGIDIAADRGIDVNPPRLFTTAKVKEEDGSTNRGMRRRGSGVLGGGGMRRVDSSGSVGSLGASIGDIFGSLGRRKSRSGPSGGSRSDLSTGGANASWDDVGGASDAGSSGYRRSSSRRDEPLRGRRRSMSRDAIARALGNLMNEHESNASLGIDEDVLRGGHGSSSGSGSRSAIAAGSAGLMRSRGSRREDDPSRGRRRRSSSQDAIARVIGKLMNSDQLLIDEDVIEKGETNALISEYVNPGDTAPEERGKDVTNEERVAAGQLGNGRRKSEPNLVVLNDVNFGDDDDKDSSTRARRGRRRSRSSDRSIDILESSAEQDHPVELTSRAAVDNSKEGAALSSRGRDRQPRQTRRGSAGGSRRRSGSIDAINRVIKAVGVKSFEFVETDAADERPVMERKSSAKLE